MPQKRYVVAVSGGIDSVVLLDALLRGRPVGGVSFEAAAPEEIVVAHFDHGIRPDSADDAEFVVQLAKLYGVKCVSRREELGANTSEEIARKRRYAFLYDVSMSEDAQLVTAHHSDDSVETIAINIVRGTGWRGLAVMDNPRIYRPLQDCSKQDIYMYAEQRKLRWREDSTNASDAYLRNRLRQKIRGLDEDALLQLLALRARQIELKHEIDSEIIQLRLVAPYSRYLFAHCGDAAASELLRAVFMVECKQSPTPSTRQRVLHDIKVARPGTVSNVMKNIDLLFTRTNFVVRHTR